MTGFNLRSGTETQKSLFFFSLCSKSTRRVSPHAVAPSLNSKISFLSTPLNIHQRMKLEVCCTWSRVCLVGAHSTSGRSHLRRGGHPAMCVRTHPDDSHWNELFREESLLLKHGPAPTGT